MATGADRSEPVGFSFSRVTRTRTQRRSGAHYRAARVGSITGPEVSPEVARLAVYAAIFARERVMGLIMGF